MKDSAEVLLQLVRRQRRLLPLNDDSAPEEVNRLTQTSKKIFKRSRVSNAAPSRWTNRE